MAKVWALDRRVFQQVMKRTGMQRIDDNLNFLRSVPLLSNLSIDHMSKIADVLEVVSAHEPLQSKERVELVSLSLRKRERYFWLARGSQTPLPHPSQNKNKQTI